MDYAICTIDNKQYKAFDFEKLEASELAQKRRFLECKCGGPAFFRKASKSGQAACFGARPHKDGCALAAQESESIDGSLTDEEKEYFNSGKEIIIDLNFGAIKVNHIVENDDDDNDKKGRGGYHSSKNGKAESKAHRRLSTLLRALINDKYFFKDSKQKIYLNGYHPYNADTLFKHSNDLTDAYVDDILDKRPNTLRAIWSMISDARNSNGDDNSIWLNTGGNDRVSVLIDEKIHNDFFDRFKIKDLEDLSGKYVLTIGKLKKSKNDKIFSKVEDISYITIV